MTLILHWLKPFAVPVLAYGLLALLILGPLLAPGVILTFDMAWTGPGWLQKLMLLAILVSAGVGGWRLARLHAHMVPAAAYLAGLFLIFNPFVYSRLMGGQYLVLAGYALLPHAIVATWSLLKSGTWRPAVELAVVAALIGWWSVHTLGMLALAVLALFIARLTTKPSPRRLIPGLALAASVWLALSAAWLVPTLLGRSGLAERLSGITPAQAEAFATSGAGAGGSPVLAAATLQGFWLDGFDQYWLPSAGWWFWVAAAGLGALMLAGITQAIRRHDRLGLALAIAGLVAFWVALGVAAPVGADATRWLLAHIPGFNGYREPGKWLMLTAVADAFLVAAGLSWLLGRVSGWRREAAVAGALLLPIIFTPLLLWGAAGQLRAASYPADWARLKERLASQSQAGPVLVLPWHAYLYIDFAQRIVANPAAAYLQSSAYQVVSSSNAELPGLSDTAKTGSLNRFVEDDVLAQRGAGVNLAGLLANRGILRVVVFKQADWREASWLVQQSGFALEAESGGWQVWRVEGRL